MFSIKFIINNKKDVQNAFSKSGFQTLKQQTGNDVYAFILFTLGGLNTNAYIIH